MKYRVIRGFIHNGAECVGDSICEFTDAEASRYMSVGKIVPYHEEAVSQPVVEIENRDPKTRGRKKTY